MSSPCPAPAGSISVVKIDWAHTEPGALECLDIVTARDILGSVKSPCVPIPGAFFFSLGVNLGFALTLDSWWVEEVEGPHPRLGPPGLSVPSLTISCPWSPRFLRDMWPLSQGWVGHACSIHGPLLCCRIQPCLDEGVVKSRI